MELLYPIFFCLRPTLSYLSTLHLSGAIWVISSGLFSYSLVLSIVVSNILFKPCSKFLISMAAFFLFIHILLFLTSFFSYCLIHMVLISFKSLTILNILKFYMMVILSEVLGDISSAVCFVSRFWFKVDCFLLHFVTLDCKFIESCVLFVEILCDFSWKHILLKKFYVCFCQVPQGGALRF